MTRNKFCFLLGFLLFSPLSPALAVTLTLSVPTSSGMITREVTSFDRSSFTGAQVYNYANAKYNGDIAIQPGTNMFFVKTLEGLSLFFVNQASGSLYGQLKYQVTTKGTLLFRDDDPSVDIDPLEIIQNPDLTTTFISTEGFLDNGCISNCKTDGLVIGLDSLNPVINWNYYPNDSNFPMTNIFSLNFWSSNPSENFSLDIGTEFNPDGGEVGVNDPSIPESSFNFGLLLTAIAAGFLKRISFF